MSHPAEPKPGPSTSDAQDFATVATATSGSTSDAPAPALPRPAPHVHYDLSIDTDVTGQSHRPGPTPAAGQAGITRSDTKLSRPSGVTPIGISPITRRRTRANTFRNLETFEDFESGGWHPGAEPGVDPYKHDGGHASMPTLAAPCKITVVDFSQDRIDTNKHTNESLNGFLRKPQPSWSECRWISVNGLSWDVIQALGQYKKLHKLSIEDIMNTKNRTKADWYSNHAFLVLTLQKLVRLVDDNSDDEPDTDTASWRSGRSGRSHKSLKRRVKSLFGLSKARPRLGLEPTLENGNGPLGDGIEEVKLSDDTNDVLLRTLQRYNASPNDARTEFMEKHSSLAPRNLAVMAEQVSLFITHDNTIISFFELSAPDVEEPIRKRLETEDTILRQACDASMVGQAIIDAIIDLAIPVTTAYSDIIGDLELDVLTHPTVKHTKGLYIITCEINKMLSFINPIINLVNALRDHKTEMTQESATKALQNPSQGVIITPMTYTYLADVLDHCILISESLNQTKGNADGLIDLIFNTISAYQNESMKQLTLATIFFLPLTFLTGYFGQNFNPFPDTQRGISFFWVIAAPMIVVTTLVLMRDMIWDSIRTLVQRRHILQLRRKRRRKAKQN